MGYCYPSGLEKTLCKCDIYVLLVTKGLNNCQYVCVFRFYIDPFSGTLIIWLCDHSLARF